MVRKVVDIVVKKKNSARKTKNEDFGVSIFEDTHENTIKEVFPEINMSSNTALKELEKKVENFEKAEILRFRREEEEKKRKRIAYRYYFLMLVPIILLSGLIYAAMIYLPRVNIKILTKKMDWNYVESINALSSNSDIDIRTKSVPAEILSSGVKNLVFSFPASGKRMVEKRAKGVITIYNAYSSEPQFLVANTRFEAPTGQIFRLEKSITIPGAKIEGGEIIPSSITAVVLADKPGAEYNIGPVARFSIPGFSGNADKFKGFYAESKNAMTGGFVGEQSYPNDEDIKKGKEEAIKKLREATDSFLIMQIPQSFKLLDDSKQFKLLKEEVKTDIDEKGNFSIYVEGESSAIVFRESDVLKLMEALGKSFLGEFLSLKNYEINYGVGQVDFAAGKLSFAVRFKGVFWQPLVVNDELKNKLVKKNDQELISFIKTLPGVEGGQIALWPFWAKKSPRDIKRINIQVD